MKASDLRIFKERLLERRKELARAMTSMKREEGEMSQREENGDVSAYSYHLADQGTDNMLQSQTFLQIERNGNEIYEIDEALERIERGKYGICESCGRSIDIQRLEALPYAPLCLRCKIEMEGIESKEFREEDLIGTFGDEPEEN